VLTEGEGAMSASGDERKEGGRRRRGRRGRGSERGTAAEHGAGPQDAGDDVTRDEVAASDDINIGVGVYDAPDRDETAPATATSQPRERVEADRAAPSRDARIDAGDIPVMAPESGMSAHGVAERAIEPPAPPRAHEPVEVPRLSPPAEPSPPARSMSTPGVTSQQQLDLPPVALTLPPGSDLVLVETTHAAPAPEPEAFDAQRPRRVRPPRVVAPSEPLEIVETRKDGPTATH
jgi:ribonuclease E